MVFAFFKLSYISRVSCHLLYARNTLNIITEFARDPWFTRAAVSLLITNPGLSNHICSQVITLVTFDTAHLIFVAMGGEL